MEVKMIIGIPIKNFNEGYTRLNKTLSINDRVKLSKALLGNIINCFYNSSNEIYLITKDQEVKNFAKNMQINSFSSTKEGLNEEVEDFLDEKYKVDIPWCIIHSDLPYINKFIAKQLEKNILANQFIASRSEDNGTPILGGRKKINQFHYGKNSFSEFKKELAKESYELYILFSRELSFEIDTEKNYSEFKKNLPNWYGEK